MAYATILFGIEDGLATITLNRPDKLNSFTTEMHGELLDAFGRVEKEGARAVLLTGAGRGFCAGQDLNDRAVAPGAERPDIGASLEKYYNPLIRKVTGLSLPVVAAVNGVAAGAGANLALACDIVVAARSASFIEAFSKIALVPDAGGSFHLPRLIGKARAMGMMLTAEKVSAETALNWGMIWKVVDDAEIAEAGRALARQLADGPTLALSMIKKAVYASADNSLDQQLDLERDLQTVAGKSDDYQEGVAAFMEKRAPRFTGK